MLKLSVPHCKQVELNTIINNYFNENDNGMRMKCSYCCTCVPVCTHVGICNQPAVSQYSLIKAPNVLFIQLNRFSNNLSSSKVNTLINTGLELKLLDCNIYELFGVLDHQGTSINSGHYITKMKNNDEWLLCNDTNISPIDFQDVVTTDNYILLFKKKENSLHPSPTIPIPISPSFIPPFIPTHEWQEVLPGQGVPPGCHSKIFIDG